MNGFVDWQTFTFKGRRFLALIGPDGVSVKGERFDNYGSYFSVESFKAMYKNSGESLNMTATSGVSK